jgi:hypothetical protein
VERGLMCEPRPLAESFVSGFRAVGFPDGFDRRFLGSTPSLFDRNETPAFRISSTFISHIKFLFYKRLPGMSGD